MAASCVYWSGLQEKRGGHARSVVAEAKNPLEWNDSVNYSDPHVPVSRPGHKLTLDRQRV